MKHRPYFFIDKEQTLIYILNKSLYVTNEN